MASNRFVALVWKEEGGFVSVLSGTNISSCGDTAEEAVEMLKEAAELYFENISERQRREILESLPQHSENTQAIGFSFNTETAY